MSLEKSSKLQLKLPADLTERRVYWLNRMERELEDGTKVTLTPSPEVLAVAIAKCSRTETPFDQNIYDATEESASAFHNKWVVGFGHASVAEHAVASVALENVSLVVVGLVEDARLGSYTEKSSRYQVYTAKRCVMPPEVAKSGMAHAYRELMAEMYGLYEKALEALDPYMRDKFPNDSGMTDGAYKSVIKARSCDVARYILPSAAMASFGVTTNARTWAYIIIKLLSSPLEEAQQIGRELIDVLHGGPDMDDELAIKRKPFRTLLKYVEANPYRMSLDEQLADLAKGLAPELASMSTILHATVERPVVMLSDDAEAENRIAAAILARYSDEPVGRYLDLLRKRLPQGKAAEIIAQALAKRGPHDAPLRELEHATFTHELISDNGAWYDVKRHRICTPLNRPLGVELGYEMPTEMADIGLDGEYRALMDKVAEFHNRLRQAGLTPSAEYVVPKAYRRRITLTWNLRELFHFIELRSGPKGHPSYRRLAQETWRTLAETHPDLAKHIRVDLSGNTLSTLGAKPKGI